MIEIYLDYIRRGKMTLEQVPSRWRKAVAKRLG